MVRMSIPNDLSNANTTGLVNQEHLLCAAVLRLAVGPSGHRKLLYVDVLSVSLVWDLREAIETGGNQHLLGFTADCPARAVWLSRKMCCFLGDDDINMGRL